ncbi:unnamed protein product [Parnassius apollo]|uniref:(apollo) hypothetical protein n=1 Tax=Parnassius apollo TaxID=110799 RepID=A0A8S3X6M4_PARAO|nr:unnamed protein product [Parnassius apollo]
MSHRTCRLEEKKIEKYLFEDIPSGNESIYSYEDDKEEAENQPNLMVLGDFIGVQIAHDDIYDSDDDLPLSSRSQRNPDSTESNNVSSNMPVMIAPKWKKNYRVDIMPETQSKPLLYNSPLNRTLKQKHHALKEVFHQTINPPIKQSTHQTTKHSLSQSTNHTHPIKQALQTSKYHHPLSRTSNPPLALLQSTHHTKLVRLRKNV